MPRCALIPAERVLDRLDLRDEVGYLDQLGRRAATGQHQVQLGGFVRTSPVIRPMAPGPA